MKKLIYAFVIFIVILFFILLFVNISRVNNELSIDNLPTGELQTTSTSPDGKYEVKLYLYSGGATTGYYMRGELVEENKKKNIYWKCDEFRTEISWIDNHTVNINGKELDVRHDVYDWRKDKEFCESIR